MKMAFEINDLKGILILVLFAIPMIASTNINCSGKAFHCVNSTHFMICVDLGGGLSTTIDDFVIPCPATTVCHENNVFECDFPEVTTPSLQVIGVYKQSDTSEPTTVTNSVTLPTPLSDMFSVLEENLTATILPIPEDVTPLVKLEVLENIQNTVGVNSNNTSDTSIQVITNFLDSTNEMINDKQTSNNDTITSSATDNNNKVDPAVETPIHKVVNTSLIDKYKSIDTVTSVIGLINLISTDPPSAVNATLSFDLSTPLDTLYDNATVAEQYVTKLVTKHGKKTENATEATFIQTDIISERSITADEVSTTIISDINNTADFVTKINSDNEKITEGNSFGKSNNKTELEPETTTEYLEYIKIVSILEPVTVVANIQTATENTLGVDLNSADSKQSVRSTKLPTDYLNPLNDNTASTIDQPTTNLETLMSDIPVTTEVIGTTSVFSTNTQNVSYNHAFSDVFTEKNSSIELTTIGNIAETTTNYYNPESITEVSLKSTTGKMDYPMTFQANFMYTTETSPIFNNSSNNDPPVQTNVIQSLDSIITTNFPMGITDNLYQINQELNQSMLTAKYKIGTISTTESVETEYNGSSYSTEPNLLTINTMKNTTIDLSTAHTLLNEFTALEITNELLAVNVSVNEAYMEDVKSESILYNMTDTTNTTETVLNASSIDIIKVNDTEHTLPPPTTLKYLAIETPLTKSLHSDFLPKAIEAYKELSATSTPISDNEPDLEIVGNTAQSVYSTPAAYYVTLEPETNKNFLRSHSDIVTNPHIGFIPENNVNQSPGDYNSRQPATTNKVSSAPVTFSGSLNQPEIPSTAKPIAVQEEIGMTEYDWNKIENSTYTPIQSVGTENTSFSDIIKSLSQNNKAILNVTIPIVPKTILPEISPTVYYVPDDTTSILKPIYTTPFSMDSTKILEQILTYTAEIGDVYTNDVETSTILPVEHITNIEKFGSMAEITMPPQQITSPKNGTVKPLNMSSRTQTVSGLIPAIVSNPGYIRMDKTKENTSNWQDLENTIISNVNPYADQYINNTGTVKQVNSTNNNNNIILPLSAIGNNNDESIKTLPVFDNDNFGVNSIPTKTLEQSSSSPLLLNDYVHTIPDINAYETATENVHEFNSLQAGESVTLNYKDTQESKVTNSVLSTTGMHTLPRTEKVQYVGTEAPIPSNVELKHINPVKPAVDYATDKTNYYLSTPVILTKLYKLPKVKAKSKVSGFTPGLTVSTDGLTTVPVYDETSTTRSMDSLYTMSSTKMTTKIIRNNNIMKISTEFPPITQKIIESSPPILEAPAAQTTTEPTYTANTFFQITSLAAIDKTNQDTLLDIRTTDTPQYLTSTVNSNKPQSIALSLIAKGTDRQTTHEDATFSETIPLGVFGKTNLDTLSGIQATDLPQYVMSTLYSNEPQPMPALVIAEVTASQRTNDPIYKTNALFQTTPLPASGITKQDALSGIRATDLLQYEVSTVNSNEPQSMPSLAIVGITTSPITTEPIHKINVFSQTTSLSPIGETNQDVLSGIKTTNMPQNAMSTVNNNDPQLIPSLAKAEVAALQMTTETTHNTNAFFQTTPLAAIGEMNQGILSLEKTTNMPQYVISTVNNNNPQSMPWLHKGGVTVLQIPSERTHTTNVFSHTTQLSAANNTLQDVLPDIKTVGLPSAMSTANNNSYQFMDDITNETNINSLAEPDSMVETIKVVADEVSGSYNGHTFSTDIIPNSPAFKNSNYDIIPVKNIKDHESIVIIGTSFKNIAPNPTLNSPKSPDINKVEIVNHTESNWMLSDVNIDAVKIKETSIEQGEASKSSVIRSVMDIKNLTEPSVSLLTRFAPEDGKTIDTIEYRLSTVTANSLNGKGANSGSAKIVTQSKTLINEINENAKSLVNTTSEIIDIKEYEGKNVSKNITGRYNTQNTKANITTSYYNLSLHNSTFNDELEQHFISTNHTITTEIQSHINESDKQSNKISDELTFVTSMHNPNLTHNKINESKKNTSVSTVSPSEFNCSNHTRGKYSDKNDCRKFYSCIGNLQPISGTCPNNTVFSEINKQCTRNLSHCVRNNQFRCLYEGRFSDFFKDNIYYICVKNRMNGFIRYKLQCHDDYHLNKEFVKCEINEDISTQSASSVSETNNDETKPKPKSEKNVTKDDFECEKEGKFPYAKDVSKYYVCTKVKNVYRRKIKKCASDEVFDKKKKKCVECDSGE